VDYGDVWMPIVYEELDLGTQMLELDRRCQEVGKPTAPVTAAIFEVDTRLMERCAELGVDRCVVIFHTEDKDGLPAFLERYTRVADRFAD
jgi:predicted urease superfamily metal-dependent hydrolase